MTIPQPLRAAIIGTGGIAHAHAQAIRDLAPRIELVAVADLDSDRARAFAEQFGAADVFATSDELFAAGGVDLVHVCTPPKTHAPLAIQSMRVGIPVLVEKPTALSLSEMDEIVRVSLETGVPALTVFQHRFGAPAQRLMRLASSGRLGRPMVATCDTLWYRTPDYFDLPWRGLWSVEGGGPTMGHGIHQFDLLLAVLGPWSRVSAFAARRALPTDTEDVSTAVVEFDSGALATVVNSIVSPRESSRLRFDFEHATVEVEHLYGYVEADWRFTPAPGHEHLQEAWQADAASDSRSSHRDQIAAIIDSLAGGVAPAGAGAPADGGAPAGAGAPGVAAGDARRTLELAAATFASAFRGQPIAAGEITVDDPFWRSMDGGAVPWHPIKNSTASIMTVEMAR